MKPGDTTWREALRPGFMRAGVTLAELQSPGRRTYLVEARREAYVILRARGWSYPNIGSLFHRDHTTILWALGVTKKARERNAGRP